MSPRTRVRTTELTVAVIQTVRLTAEEMDGLRFDEGDRDARSARAPRKQDITYLAGYHRRRQEMGYQEPLILPVEDAMLAEALTEAFHAALREH